MSDITIITRRIDLAIIGEDEQTKNEQWKFLRDLSHKVFRAANTIVSEQWLNQNLTYKIMGGKKDAPAEERKALLKETKDLLFDCSTENTTYRSISKLFPEIPSSVRSSLNRKVYKAYQASVADVMRGQRTLSNYKLGMPIPFNLNKDVNKFTLVDKNYHFRWLNDIRFTVLLGRDRSDNKSIIDRIISGDYSMSDSAIVCDKTELYMLLSVKIPKRSEALDPEKTAATNLGMNCPVCLVIGDKTFRIGDKEHFLGTRLQFQRRDQELKRSLRDAKGSHGRHRKMEAREKLRVTEKNFAKTYNHKMSSDIVRQLIRHRVGTLITENLLGSSETLGIRKNQTPEQREFAQAFAKRFVLRNWGYFQLQEFIKYKFEQAGGRLVYRDPANITRKCHTCKTVSDEAVDLKDRTYTCCNPDCPDFNVPKDIDANAALNVRDDETELINRAKKN